MDERFKRGGFQGDGTYVQPISRQTPGPDGRRGYNAPLPGAKIATSRGPFKVAKLIGDVFFHKQTPYFRARGELVGRK